MIVAFTRAKGTGNSTVGDVLEVLLMSRAAGWRHLTDPPEAFGNTPKSVP